MSNTFPSGLVQAGQRSAAQNGGSVRKDGPQEEAWGEKPRAAAPADTEEGQPGREAAGARGGSNRPYILVLLVPPP